MSRYRWTWPKKAKRLTEWLTSAQIRELAGEKACAGAKEGRSVRFDGNKAWVERRESEKGEPGKYRYRLVCSKSLAKVYSRLDRSRWVIEEPELGLKTYMGYNENFCLKLCVRFSYDQVLVDTLRAWGGSWDADYRVWVFDEEDLFEDVLELVRTHYMLDQEDRRLSVTVSTRALFPTLVCFSSVELFRLPIIKRRADWSRATLQKGVSLLGDDLLDPCARLVIENVRSSFYDESSRALGELILGVTTEPVDTIGRRELRPSERLALAAISSRIECAPTNARPPRDDEPLEQWAFDPCEPPRQTPSSSWSPFGDCDFEF